MNEPDEKTSAASKKVREAERKHVGKKPGEFAKQWGEPHGIPEHDGMKEARDRGLR